MQIPLERVRVQRAKGHSIPFLYSKSLLFSKTLARSKSNIVRSCNLYTHRSTMIVHGRAPAATMLAERHSLSTNRHPLRPSVRYRETIEIATAAAAAPAPIFLSSFGDGELQRDRRNVVAFDLRRGRTLSIGIAVRSTARRRERTSHS